MLNCAPCFGRRGPSARSIDEQSNTAGKNSVEEALKQPAGPALAPERRTFVETAGPAEHASDAQLRPSPSESSAAAVTRIPSSDTNALQSKLKVPFSELTFHALIGKGSFKQVYRGKWNNTNVAIVAMRKGGLVTEARLMQQLGSHPNLCQFYRWSTDARGNEYVVCELVPFGSLDKVLAHFGPSLRNRSKLMMCEQICHAMSELASEGVLHRDLAARNILVQSMQPVHIKVSDFGLSRAGPAPLLEPSDSTVGEGAGQRGAQPEEEALVPVRWSAPEVLRSGGGWSEKSDVWAYGITCWEIFSNGAEPYPSRSDAEAAFAIMNGELLPRPKNCPQPVYSLMVNCWAADPRQRPSFRQIADVFRRWREATLAAKAASGAGAGGGSGTNSPAVSSKLPLLSGVLPVEPAPASPTAHQQLHQQLQQYFQNQLVMPRAAAPLSQVLEVPLSSHDTPQALSNGVHAGAGGSASAVSSGPEPAAPGGGYVPITALWRPDTEAAAAAQSLAPIQSGEVLHVIDSGAAALAPRSSGAAHNPSFSAAHTALPPLRGACAPCDADGASLVHVAAEHGTLAPGQPHDTCVAATGTADADVGRPACRGVAGLQVMSATPPTAQVDSPDHAALPTAVQLSVEALTLQPHAGSLTAMDARQPRGPGPASGPTVGQSMVCSADVWLEPAMLNEATLSHDVSPSQAPGVQTPPQHQQSQPLPPRHQPMALSVSSGSGGVSLQPAPNGHLSDPGHAARVTAIGPSAATVRYPGAGHSPAASATALGADAPTAVPQQEVPLPPADTATPAAGPHTVAHAAIGAPLGTGTMGAGPGLPAEPLARYSSSGVMGPAPGTGPPLPRVSRRGGGGGGPGGFAAVPNFGSISSGPADDGRRSSRSALRWAAGASGAGPEAGLPLAAYYAGGSTVGMFYETCVLSMEVETAIDPMISMSTAASNANNIFRGYPGASGHAGAGISSGGVLGAGGTAGTGAHRLSAAARQLALGLGDACRPVTGGMDSGERALRSLQGIMFMRQGTAGVLSTTEVAADEAAGVFAPANDQELPPTSPASGGGVGGLEYLGEGELPLDNVAFRDPGGRMQASPHVAGVASPLVAAGLYPPAPAGMYGAPAGSEACVPVLTAAGSMAATGLGVAVGLTRLAAAPAAEAPAGSSNPYVTIRELHQGNPY